MGEGTVDRRVNVGLAGLGRFGQLHASILARLPNANLVAICDPVSEFVETVGDRHGVPGRYTDFDAFIQHPGLDCVSIVTPEGLHFEQVKAAIDRKMPVFVEKPLSFTADQGRQLVAAAEAAGVTIQVGFVLRFETQHSLLKEEIQSGRFGQIVSMRVKRNCTKAWFEVFGDRAHSVHETVIHDIDLVLWFLGQRCQKVYAAQRHITGHRYPDATMAMLQFDGGTMVNVETSWFVPAQAPANVFADNWFGTIDAELEIVGTERSARLRLLESGLQIWTSEVTQHPESGLWPLIHGGIGGALREEVAHFIDNVRLRRASDVASVADAVAGLEIAEAIMASAERGVEIVLP